MNTNHMHIRPLLIAVVVCGLLVAQVAVAGSRDSSRTVATASAGVAKKLKGLQRQIDELKGRAAVPGPAGPRGNDGAAGAPGVPGTPGTDASAPPGAVMFFNLEKCPEGWAEFTRAQGRYLVARPDGGSFGPDSTVGTALSNLENRAVGQHSHAITDPGHDHNIDGGISRVQEGSGILIDDHYSPNYQNDDFPTGSAQTGITINSAGTVAGTNAPYMQLTVCEKS